MFIAQLIANIVMIYAAIGAGFAIAFVVAGVGKIDPAAAGAGVGFRLLILPGAAALWPLLLLRWLLGAQHPPQETNAHRQAARALETNAHRRAAREVPR